MDDNSHSLSFLTKGSQVEVTSDEHGFAGPWFVATVICPPPSISTPSHLVYVEYHHLFTESPSSSPTRLREYANVACVRPSPERHLEASVCFELNDVVDAFCRDAWWTGVVSNVFENDYFEVTFGNPPDKIRVNISDLRVHRKWSEPRTERTSWLMFDVGTKVEVSFEKETLRDVWFPATVLKVVTNRSFLVEYQRPGNGDEGVLCKVMVDDLHWRPTPPNLRFQKFDLLEKVDAYYDFGWWSGVITKELADNRYHVFFKHTKKTREFLYSKVRPHIEWKGGQWFNTSKGDTDGRTLIGPDTFRQYTVESSSLKTTKQPENINSNDKNSMPSEKSTDPSKKTNKSSVGQFQSEGFDSEISGMNDQSVVKTENLSHGKKVRGKRGNSTELETPMSDFSRKRGKEDSGVSGDKVDSVKIRSQEITEKTNVTKSVTLPVVSVKTRAQEIAQKTDVNKDFSLPVVSVKKRAQEIAEKTDVTKDGRLHDVVGSQCNGVEILQGKLLQKLPVEKIPDVPESVTKQSDVTLAPVDVPLKSLLIVDKMGSGGDAASVTPKRKRGRPPIVRTKMPDEPVTEELLEPVAQNEVLMSKEKQGTKKYSSKKGRLEKRRTISVNTTKAPAQDASKEKEGEILDKDSAKKSPEPSAGKSLATISDDQPLASLLDGRHAPVTVNALDGTTEKSSSQFQLVACDIDLPFMKSTPLWKAIESMEAFQKLPQRPHFRPLFEDVKTYAREGLAIGKMVTFTNVVEKTCGLRFTDPKSTIHDCLEILVELEPYGFEVESVRARLTGLLSLKDKQVVLEEESKGSVEKAEEYKIHEKNIEEEIDDIDRQLRELEEKRKQVMLKKKKMNLEIGSMKATVEKIAKKMEKIGAEFDGLASAPF